MAVDAQGQEEARKRREAGAWSTPERAALLSRVRPHMGAASSVDLLEYARVELWDALDNVDPIEGGDEFHAGCCMMRAESAIYHVAERLKASGAASADPATLSPREEQTKILREQVVNASLVHLARVKDGGSHESIDHAWRAQCSAIEALYQHLAGSDG